MTTPPRFSILLPTHNRADVLPFAIRSALWQTEDDYELLIVGDGCTDGTAEVVASFRDRRIRWFDLPKGPGLGYANRNAALREARGRLVAYLPHDDIWFPDHLERLGSLLETRGAELVYSRALAVGIDGVAMPYWFNLEAPGSARGLADDTGLIALCTVVHTRSCLTKYGYWDETLEHSGDRKLWRAIIGGGGYRNFAFLSEPTSLRFVADRWRTIQRQRRRRFGRWLVEDILADVLPAALRFPVEPDRTEQSVAWQRLAADTPATVREIRRAVGQLQDAVLWRVPTSLPGLLGIRLGLTTGRAVERLWKELRRVAGQRPASLRPCSSTAKERGAPGIRKR